MTQIPDASLVESFKTYVALVESFVVIGHKFFHEKCQEYCSENVSVMDTFLSLKMDFRFLK